MFESGQFEQCGAHLDLIILWKASMKWKDLRKFVEV